jgi:hypothetical protein
MDKYSEIAQSIRRLSGKTATAGGFLPFFLVQIKSVDGDRCTVEYEGAEFSDVRLRAVLNSETSKILVTPKVGSYVLAVDLSGDLTELTALQYSEVDRIEVNCDNIIFNGGDKGIVKIKELSDKLKALESKLNDHTHIVPAGGVSVTTANGPAANPAPVSVPAISNKSAEFQSGYSDFEDKKIKH